MAKAKARPLSCPAQGPPPRGSRCRARRGQTSPSPPLPGSQPWLDPWLRELSRADSPSSHRRPRLLGRRGTQPPPRTPLQLPPFPINFAGALPLPPPPPPQLLFIHARHCPRDRTLLWAFLPRPPHLNNKKPAQGPTAWQTHILPGPQTCLHKHGQAWLCLHQLPRRPGSSLSTSGEPSWK